jgi:hypothetical protein
MTNEEIKTHKRDQSEGLRPPPQNRIVPRPGTRSRTNRKSQMKRQHGHQLDQYASYLLDRLAIVRELQRERDNDG